MKQIHICCIENLPFSIQLCMAHICRRIVDFSLTLLRRYLLTCRSPSANIRFLHNAAISRIPPVSSFASSNSRANCFYTTLVTVVKEKYKKRVHTFSLFPPQTRASQRKYLETRPCCNQVAPTRIRATTLMSTSNISTIVSKIW
jgi:hypothetical protein